MEKSVAEKADFKLSFLKKTAPTKYSLNLKSIFIRKEIENHSSMKFAENCSMSKHEQNNTNHVPIPITNT